VMQSSELPSDLAHLDSGSHIFRTLDDGWMGLFLTDLVMLAHRWVGIPHVGHYTPGIITHWMEDVTLVDSWMPCKGSGSVSGAFFI
jgi:hypothetical protein